MTTHGEAIGGRTKEYRAWKHIRERCHCKSNNTYGYYGGRGISVCRKWMDSYESFLADMGRAPTPRHTIDRINNNGNYTKGNCRWATVAEQAKNRRSTILIKINGKTMCLYDWCKLLSLRPATIKARVLEQGMSYAAAMKIPKRKSDKYRNRNKPQLMAESTVPEVVT